MPFRNFYANMCLARPAKPAAPAPGRARGYLPGRGELGGTSPALRTGRWSPPHTAPRLRTAPLHKCGPKTRGGHHSAIAIAGRCPLDRPGERPVKAGEPLARPTDRHSSASARVSYLDSGSRLPNVGLLLPERTPTSVIEPSRAAVALS